MASAGLSRDQTTTKQPMRWHHWLLALGISAAVFGICIYLMSRMGLLEPATDETNEKTLAAALALIGTALTAAVTLVGILLKFSSDERSARLAEEEGFRNRIDVSLRAVDLLGENNTDAAQAQASGALLALVNLGELDLAISLLADLWPRNRTSLYVASQVLQAAFRSDSPGAKLDAACVLEQNADHLALQGITAWPFETLEWPLDLEKTTRLTLVRAAARWLRKSILRDSAMPPNPVVILYNALGDSDKEVNEIAAGALCPVAGACPKGQYVAPSGEVITGSAIRKRACGVCPKDEAMTDRFKETMDAVTDALRERQMVKPDWQPAVFNGESCQPADT
jgi:hypothetical protein